MSTFYKAADDAIVVFDLTILSTFITVINWITELLKNLQIIIFLIILVDNKVHLINKGTHNTSLISSDQGFMLAEKISNQISGGKIKTLYIETSAKSRINIELVFKEIIQLVLNK